MSKESRVTSSTGGQKGVKMERFDLIPTGPLLELATHFGRGARKYEDHQWRKGYEWSKSYSAIHRHLSAFWSGYGYDVCSNDPDGCSNVDSEGNVYLSAEPDTCYNHTGSHHMVAVAWHAFVLLEFKVTHPDHDDRYISNREADLDEISVSKEWLDETNLFEAFKAPSKLVYIHKPSSTNESVCICSEEERAREESLIVHYRAIHNIIL